MIHSIKTVVICLLSTLVICSLGYPFTIGDKNLVVVDNFSYHDTYKKYNNSGYEVNVQNCICNATIKECKCAFLKDAVAHVENNTIIAIRSRQDFVSSNIQLWNIFNLSIIGYHTVVKITCHKNASVEFKSCNNIVIENIIWSKCGYNLDRSPYSSYDIYEQNFDEDFWNYYFFGISFVFCENITLKLCTFKNSMIGFDTVSNTVCMGHVHFISDDISDINPYLKDTSLATGFVINQTNDTIGKTNIVVKITNSLFTQNKNNTTFNLLLMYIIVNDPNSSIQVLVNQTNFSSVSCNSRWSVKTGMVWIRMLSYRNAYIKFSGVKFHSNKFAFNNDINPGIASILQVKITSTDIYTNNAAFDYPISNVTIESCSFLNNAAHIIAQFEGDMYLDVINTSFSNNKADYMFVILTNYHNFNYADFITLTSITVTTALQVLDSTFFNNSCGSIICLNGTYILAIISGVLIKHNSILPGNSGAVSFLNYDTLVANLINIMFEFNNMMGESDGFKFVSMGGVQTSEGRSISHSCIMVHGQIKGYNQCYKSFVT